MQWFIKQSLTLSLFFFLLTKWGKLISFFVVLEDIFLGANKVKLALLNLRVLFQNRI